MEDTVTVSLLHAGVNVVARVAQFGDFLGQKLDALGRVTEYDALVDLQLNKTIRLSDENEFPIPYFGEQSV